MYGKQACFGARYYMPEMRRFISADTLIPGASNPLAYNRYSYVFNNPVMFTDPTGHAPTCEQMGEPETCYQDDSQGLYDLDFVPDLPEGGAETWNDSIIDHVVGQCYQGNGYFSPIPDYCEHAGVAVEELGDHDIAVNPTLSTEEIYQFYLDNHPNVLWRGAPDYTTANLGLTAAVAGTIAGPGGSGQVVVDRYGNVYGGWGVHAGFGFLGSTGFSWVAGFLENHANRNSGQLVYVMPESVVEERLRGGGVGASLFVIVGGGIATTPIIPKLISGDPIEVEYREAGGAFELGGAIQYTHNTLIYDANAPKPWFGNNGKNPLDFWWSWW